MSNVEPKSPLTIIAIFAGIIEASALASLPFLSDDSQNTYTWFLVGFPFFLTVLFFLTLNFNNKSLFSPPATEVVSTAISTSPQKPKAIEDSVISAVQTPEQPQTCDESVSPPGVNDTGFFPESEVESSNAPTTVTIYISGDNSDQLIRYFVTHALCQARPLCNTWVLHNLESGIQTTLATQSIDR